MSQRMKTNKGPRRRGFTYLWIFGLAVLVFTLIYLEQTALLYVFATLGVTALLVVVAAADLGRGEPSVEAPQFSDAQAASSGTSSRVPAAKTRK